MNSDFQIRSRMGMELERFPKVFLSQRQKDFCAKNLWFSGPNPKNFPIQSQFWKIDPSPDCSPNLKILKNRSQSHGIPMPTPGQPHFIKKCDPIKTMNISNSPFLSYVPQYVDRNDRVLRFSQFQEKILNYLIRSILTVTKNHRISFKLITKITINTIAEEKLFLKHLSPSFEFIGTSSQ